jgi:mannonate dehydratase
VPHQLLIGKELGDLSDLTLGFFRQIGVEAVGLPPHAFTKVRRSRPMLPPAQLGPAAAQPEPPGADELRRMVARVEAAGLRPMSMSLSLSGRILMGLPGAEEDLARVNTHIEAAGAAGLRVMPYSFTALRASEGYYLLDRGGRGAELRAFDLDRIRDRPPVAEVGVIDRESMWHNLSTFLRAVVPVAERARVRLAAHPNDPPVAMYRGVAQPLRTLEDLRRLIAVVDSPSNGIYLDTGVVTEMGADASAAIRFFGARDRISQVHFRNVHVEIPFERYTEEFIDVGDCDMLGAMQALHDVDYQGMVEPDHTPGISGDTTDTWIGWAFTIGHILGLRKAAEAGGPSRPRTPHARPPAAGSTF